MTIREESEIKRYMNIYGIDFKDLSIYDLVLNTDDLSPENIVDLIMESAKKWMK